MTLTQYISRWMCVENHLTRVKTFLFDMFDRFFYVELFLHQKFFIDIFGFRKSLVLDIERQLLSFATV